jgi:hypothetical protein
MDSPEKKTVPVAYVTKWATTAGILVLRDVELSDVAPGSLWHLHGHIRPSDWTEDRVTAEGRWRQAMAKTADAAEKKAKRLRAAAALAPKYTER